MSDGTAHTYWYHTTALAGRAQQTRHRPHYYTTSRLCTVHSLLDFYNPETSAKTAHFAAKSMASWLPKSLVLKLSCSGFERAIAR